MYIMSTPNPESPMVIGYSFSDQHIDDVIYQAWQHKSLDGLFSVGPNGRKVFYKQLPTQIKVPYKRSEIRSLGESTPPLRARPSEMTWASSRI